MVTLHLVSTSSSLNRPTGWPWHQPVSTLDPGTGQSVHLTLVPVSQYTWPWHQSVSTLDTVPLNNYTIKAKISCELPWTYFSLI